MQRIGKSGKVWIIAAAVLFLIHIFIPHHHHGDDICFVGFHCHECAAEGNHQEGAGHTGGPCGNDDVCLFKQFSILPANEARNVCLRFELPKSQYHQQSVSYFDLLIMQEERELTAFDFVIKRPTQAIPSVDKRTSDTLRAPPLV